MKKDGIRRKKRNTLKSGIVVLVGINVLVGRFVKNYKSTGWNKIGGKNCIVYLSDKHG